MPVSPDEDLFDLADAEERQNRPHAAVEAYQRLLEQEPDNASAAINLGLLHKYLGNNQAALESLFHAQAVKPELRITDACRLLDGGPIFGYAQCAEAKAIEASAFLRQTLLGNGGFSAAAMRRRLLQGEGFDPSSPPTGRELLLLRKDADLRQALLDGPQPEGVLLSLYALGVAIPFDTAASALGAATLERLLELGLLLHPPQPEHDVTSPRLVASPVQIYPLAMSNDVDNGDRQSTKPAAASVETPDILLAAASVETPDILLATDWDLEGMLPTKWSVMPIGNDSLNLVHLAPRDVRCARLLDVCCGSGIQALAALRTHADTAVAADVSPRAVGFTLFNAHLNGYADRLTVRRSDVYDGIRALGPFDAVLANPPFVAVPPPPAGLSENVEWALYADGGPDGADVVRKIVAGADDALLRPGGRLSMVSEFPNIRAAARWLPALGEGSVETAMQFAVIYEPVAHVQTAEEYAADRSDERGWPWGNVEAWKASLAASGVDEMGSGLVFALKRGSTPGGADCPLRGPPREADLSLLESAGPTVERLRDRLLAGASASELEAIAREHQGMSIAESVRYTLGDEQ